MKYKISLLFLLLIGGQIEAQLINSSTFGMMEARHLGPGTMSGRITAIDGVNNEPRIIYVGTAGGGIWKSTNAGVTFKSLFDHYCQSIGAVYIDQKNPKSRIFLKTFHPNFFKNAIAMRWPW